MKDEIEVVHLKDGSRSSNRRSFRPLSIRPDNNQMAYTVKDEGRLNGYSNGYGSASDMEINDELPDDEDDLSDDAMDGNLEDLPMPPSPSRKVSI